MRYLKWFVFGFFVTSAVLTPVFGEEKDSKDEVDSKDKEVSTAKKEGPKVVRRAKDPRDLLKAAKDEEALKRVVRPVVQKKEEVEDLKSEEEEKEEETVIMVTADESSQIQEEEKKPAEEPAVEMIEVKEVEPEELQKEEDKGGPEVVTAKEPEIKNEVVETKAPDSQEEAKPERKRKSKGERKAWKRVELIKDEFARIGKIYEYLNDPERTRTGKNKSLEFEGKYFNYGAVTKAQKQARIGKYYVVNWYNEGDEANFVLKLEYRQEKTRDKVHVMQIPFAYAKGHQKGTFAVTGKAYRENGQVLAWRLTLEREGKVVSEKRSFVW